MDFPSEVSSCGNGATVIGAYAGAKTITSELYCASGLGYFGGDGIPGKIRHPKELRRFAGD
jgi:hypothetical protein